jgi:hypothetical protein
MSNLGSLQRAGLFPDTGANGDETETEFITSSSLPHWHFGVRLEAAVSTNESH